MFFPFVEEVRRLAWASLSSSFFLSASFFLCFCFFTAFGLSGLVRLAPPGIFNFFIFRDWSNGQCEKIIR